MPCIQAREATISARKQYFSRFAFRFSEAGAEPLSSPSDWQKKVLKHFHRLQAFRNTLKARLLGVREGRETAGFEWAHSNRTNIRNISKNEKARIRRRSAPRRAAPSFRQSPRLRVLVGRGWGRTRGRYKNVFTRWVFVSARSKKKETKLSLGTAVISRVQHSYGKTWLTPSQADVSSPC